MTNLKLTFRNFTKAIEKWTLAASAMLSSLAVRISTSIYCCLLA